MMARSGITKGKFESWRPTWSPDGTRIAFDANEPDHYGDRHLYIATINGDPAKATITALTAGRGTDIAPLWSPDGTRLVYQHTDAHNSADLWVIDAKPNAKPLRVSDSMPASMDKSAFVEPESIHYAGPDGQQVPAWLFVPKNLDRTKKHPAIVWIHGDGVNQNYDGWHVQRNYAVYYSMHQYLLQQGYVVIAPDYRGSIGYGRAWREGVYMDVGGKDAKDAWMAANYLKTLGYVDTDRVGVWGLSYGGFFTLIAVTDQPKLFRAAVDVAGVVDYAMYYEDPYHGGWTASRIGTPAEHPDVYANASPISHVDRLARPLLILHGTSDVNVPYLQSVRLIDELLKKGKGPLVQFMTYPGNSTTSLESTCSATRGTEWTISSGRICSHRAEGRTEVLRHTDASRTRYTDHMRVIAIALFSVTPLAAQARKPIIRKPTPPPSTPAKRVVPEMTCPTPLGAGVTSKTMFCDVLTGRDPQTGIIVTLPPHRGTVTLTFDLHNRQTYSEDDVRRKRAYAKYTATVGVLTMDNTLVSRAVVQNEFRTGGRSRRSDIRRRGPRRREGGRADRSQVDHVVIPEGEDRVSILGEKLTVERVDGTATYASPGRPIAVINNVMIEYHAGPPGRPIKKKGGVE